MNKKIVVGVSGGADSVALLHYLWTNNYDITCVHVNYHKRQTSMRDQRHVENMCKAWNIEFSVCDYDSSHTGNFQKEARDFRYAYMVQVLKHKGASCIAVAHHFSDVLETYIMQSEDGRVVNTYGMDEYSTLYGVSIWRPFISWEKSQIHAYCKTHDLLYYDDESNFELDYRRNQVRQDILNLSCTAYEDLVVAYQNDRANSQQEYELVKKAVDCLVYPLTLDQYESIDRSIRLRVLREWLVRVGVHVYDKSIKFIEEIERTFLIDQCAVTVGYKHVVSSYGSLYVYEKLEYAYRLETEVKSYHRQFFEILDEGTTIEGVTLYPQDYPIVVRNGRESDKITLRYGTKALNRFFIDRKIPIPYRQTWPVIENAVGEIVYIVGIGCDIHHFSNIPCLFMVKL